MPAVCAALGTPPLLVLSPLGISGVEKSPDMGPTPKDQRLGSPWEAVRSDVDLQARVACRLTMYTDRIFSGTPICPQYSLLEDGYENL